MTHRFIQRKALSRTYAAAVCCIKFKEWNQKYQTELNEIKLLVSSVLTIEHLSIKGLYIREKTLNKSPVCTESQLYGKSNNLN